MAFHVKKSGADAIAGGSGTDVMDGGSGNDDDGEYDGHRHVIQDAAQAPPVEALKALEAGVDEPLQRSLAERGIVALR